MEYSLRTRLARATKCIDAICDILKREIKVANYSFDVRGNTTIIRSGEEALRAMFDISNIIRNYFNNFGQKDSGR